MCGFFSHVHSKRVLWLVPDNCKAGFATLVAKDPFGDIQVFTPGSHSQKLLSQKSKAQMWVFIF